MHRFRLNKWTGSAPIPIVTLGFCLLLPSTALAGSIHIAWDPVPAATGYRVYYGTSPGLYTQTLSVGAQPQAILSNLADCTDWYIAVKAFNAEGESRQFSNEINGWPRPSVGSVQPSTAEQGERLTLDLYGANFEAGGRLSLGENSVPSDLSGAPLIRVESTSVLSCNHLQASVTVEPTSRGVRAMEVGAIGIDFVVNNPDSVFGHRVSNFEVLFDLLRWDINRDASGSLNRIDGADLSWLSYSYGSREGEPYFDPDADLNGDGEVDGEDLAYLASGFGLCWTGEAWSADACP